jgi:nucleotide-binding universal stress UspA family protein
MSSTNGRSEGRAVHLDEPGGLGELRDRVIVGVDGSEGSQLALDWAANKAESLGPVVPVAAYHIDSLVDGVGSVSVYDDMIDVLRQDAEARVEASTKAHPEVAANGRVVRGYPGPALVKAAEDQRLLVVGSRGRSALVETLLGSVASYCVKHATVPVAVIPHETPTDQPMKHLVVGVDGSPNSDAALAWAARHVAPGGKITALTCRVPAPYALELVPPPPLPFSELKAVVDQAVARTVESVGDVDAEIVSEVVDGDPRMALRDAAEQADLLVIGSRGHRGAAYLLVGSVTTSLVHHPTVPTVVVPAS